MCVLAFICSTPCEACRKSTMKELFMRLGTACILWFSFAVSIMFHVSGARHKQAHTHIHIQRTHVTRASWNICYEAKVAQHAFLIIHAQINRKVSADRAPTATNSWKNMYFTFLVQMAWVANSDEFAYTFYSKDVHGIHRVEKEHWDLFGVSNMWTIYSG